MDSSDLAFTVLPAALGIALVVFAAYRIRTLDISFFHVTSSWFVTLFFVSILGLFIFELSWNSVGSEPARFRSQVDVTFAAVTMWLSTCAVSLTTIYRRHNLSDDFRAFLRTSPINTMTVWGVIALLLIIAAWLSGMRFESNDLVDHTVLLSAVATYLIGGAAFDVALPLYAELKGEIPHRTKKTRLNAYMLGAAWGVTPFTTYGLDLIAGGSLGLDKWNPYLWLVAILLALMIRSISVSRFSTVRVDPEIETARREGFRPYDIPRGVYLVYDERPDSAMSLFSELVTLPLRPDAAIPEEKGSAVETLEYLIPRGLMVTRAFPDEVRAKYGLQATPIVWLTESVGEMRIAPTSLAVLTDTLMRFMENNHNSIVLLEGIEYTITFNDFRKVIRSLDLLNETAWITKARLILSVDPSTFDIRERALLERDRIVLTGATGIEELKRESMVSGTAR